MIFDYLLTNDFLCFSNIFKFQKLFFILWIFFIFIRHCYLQNLIDFENITNKIIDDFTNSKSFFKIIKTFEQQKLRQHRLINDVFASFIKIHTNRRNKKSIDQSKNRHKSLFRHQANLSKNDDQVEKFTHSSSSIVLKNSFKFKKQNRRVTITKTKFLNQQQFSNQSKDLIIIHNKIDFSFKITIWNETKMMINVRNNSNIWFLMLKDYVTNF